MYVIIISSHIIKFKICCVKLHTKLRGQIFFVVALVENVIVYSKVPYLSKPLSKQPTYGYFRGLKNTINWSLYNDDAKIAHRQTLNLTFFAIGSYHRLVYFNELSILRSKRDL